MSIIQLALKSLIGHLPVFVHDLLLGVGPAGGEATKTTFKRAGTPEFRQGHPSRGKAHGLQDVLEEMALVDLWSLSHILMNHGGGLTHYIVGQFRWEGLRIRLRALPCRSIDVASGRAGSLAWWH